QPLSALTMLLSRHTRRREFITLLSGAAVTWPLAARAQQPERVRRIGSLPGIADDSTTQARPATFLETLQQLGWTQRQNVQVDRRGAGVMPTAFENMQRNWPRSPRM